LIDSVAWGEAANAFGEGSVFGTNPGANQSIQRKRVDGNFLDTDNNANDFELTTCPSPKAAFSACSLSNQSPTAFFSFTPQVPLINQTISFNAASSSDPDGQIAAYSWDFGDGSLASSTSSTIDHSYSAAGNYEVRLIVFDNQGASSTVYSLNINPLGASSSSRAPASVGQSIAFWFGAAFLAFLVRARNGSKFN
jgi:PKD repeat protein